MASSSKRQTTMAKRNREQLVKERRDLKRQKKEAARNADPAEAIFTDEPAADEEIEAGVETDEATGL